MTSTSVQSFVRDLLQIAPKENVTAEKLKSVSKEYGAFPPICAKVQELLIKLENEVLGTKYAPTIPLETDPVLLRKAEVAFERARLKQLLAKKEACLEKARSEVRACELEKRPISQAALEEVQCILRLYLLTNPNVWEVNSANVCALALEAGSPLAGCLLDMFKVITKRTVKVPVSALELPVSDGDSALADEYFDHFESVDLFKEKEANLLSMIENLRLELEALHD